MHRFVLLSSSFFSIARPRKSAWYWIGFHFKFFLLCAGAMVFSLIYEIFLHGIVHFIRNNRIIIHFCFDLLAWSMAYSRQLNLSINNGKFVIANHMHVRALHEHARLFPRSFVSKLHSKAVWWILPIRHRNTDVCITGTAKQQFVRAKEKQRGKEKEINKKYAYFNIRRFACCPFRQHTLALCYLYIVVAKAVAPAWHFTMMLSNLFALPFVGFKCYMRYTVANAGDGVRAIANGHYYQHS